MVIIPPPFRGNYVYQGLKPAVIVLSEDNLEDSDLFEEVKKQEVLDHIEKKQLELNEKLKAKRAETDGKLAYTSLAIFIISSECPSELASKGADTPIAIRSPFSSKQDNSSQANKRVKIPPAIQNRNEQS